MKKTNKRILSWLLTAAMLLSLFTAPMSVFAEAPADTDVFYGVCGHSYNREAYKAENVAEYVHLAANMGATMYRFDVYNTDEAGFTWLKNILDLCDAYGMEPMVIVYQSEVAAAVAKEFGDRITYYQMWNEEGSQAINGNVDGNDASHYDSAKLAASKAKMEATGKAIAENDADGNYIRLVNETWKHTYYIDYLLENEVPFEMIGWDWYSDMDGNNYSLEECIAALDEYGKPFIFTELNARPNDADHNAETYITACLDVISGFTVDTNCKGALVYELLDEPYESGEEAQFGLVNVDTNNKIGAVKPAYTALQEYLGGGDVEFIPVGGGKDLPVFGFEAVEGATKAPEYTGYDPSWNTDIAYVSEGIGSVKKPLGNASVYANTMNITWSEGVDVTGFKNLALDLYVADINTYNAYWKDKLVFQFFNQAIKGDGREEAALWYPINQELKQGWNTLYIDISAETELTSLSSIRLYTGIAGRDNYLVNINQNNGNYVPATADAKTDLYFDNLRATNKTAEPGETVILSLDENTINAKNDRAYFETNIKTQGNGSVRAQLGNESVWANSMWLKFDGVNFTGYQTLKFDMYIIDIEKYNEFWQDRLVLQLYDTIEKDDGNQAVYYKRFPTGLKQGWNTVRMSISDAATEGLLSNILKLRIAIVDKANESGAIHQQNNWTGAVLPSDPNCKMDVYFDNFCATTRADILFDADKRPGRRNDEADMLGPNYSNWKSINNAYFVSEGTHSMLSKVTLDGPWPDSIFTRMAPVNMVGAQTISFDMYIDEKDIDTYNAYLNGKTYFQLFDSVNTEGASALYYAYLPEDLKAGVNHITLDVSTASASFTDVVSLRICFGDNAATWNNNQGIRWSDISANYPGAEKPSFYLHFDNFTVSYEDVASSHVIYDCDALDHNVNYRPGWTDKSISKEIKTQGAGSLIAPLGDSGTGKRRLALLLNNGVELSGASILSFDFYVEDLEKYNKWWDGKMWLQLYDKAIIDNGTDDAAAYWTAFPRALNEGWNRIEIDVSALEIETIYAIGVVQTVNDPENNPWEAGGFFQSVPNWPSDPDCNTNVYYDNFCLEYGAKVSAKEGYTIGKGIISDEYIEFDGICSVDSLVWSSRLEKTFMKVSSEGNVGTGASVKVLNLYGEKLVEYSAVVYGDLDGDGITAATDLALIRKALIGAGDFEGAFAKAADCNKDNSFDIRDLIRAKKQAS